MFETNRQVAGGKHSRLKSACEINLHEPKTSPGQGSLGTLGGSFTATPAERNPMRPFLFEPNVVSTLTLTRSARLGSGRFAPEDAVAGRSFLSPEQTYTTTWANTHPLITPPSLAPKNNCPRTRILSHTPHPDTHSQPSASYLPLRTASAPSSRDRPEPKLTLSEAVRPYTGCFHHYTTPWSAGSRPAGLFLIHSRGCRRPPPPPLRANPVATISAGCHSSCTRPGH